MTIEARGNSGERRADNPVRAWVRKTLERTTILPEHRRTVSFLHVPDDLVEGYTGVFNRTLILPPVSTPEMIQVRDLLSQTVNEVGGQALINYYGTSQVGIEKISGETERLTEIVGDALSQSSAIRGFFEGIFDYYSAINGIEPPRRTVLDKIEIDESVDEEYLIRHGSYEPDNFLTSEGFLPNPNQETRIISLHPQALFRSGANGTNAFIDIPVHEWLHHLFNVLRNDYGLYDLSNYEDNMHTQRFSHMLQHMGIEPLILSDQSEVEGQNGFLRGIASKIKKLESIRLDEELDKTMVYEGSPNRE